MAYTITQLPAALSFAESPIVFTVLDTTNVNKDQYQYVMKLKYWTGSYAQEPAAFNYVVQKYPNASGYGMFDVSKIISSLFVSAEQNSNQLYNYKAYFNFIYYTSSTNNYITGSDVTSSVNQAIDGYQIWNNDAYIEQGVDEQAPYWPIMSSMPQTQSAYYCHVCGDTGNVGYLPVMRFYELANSASITASDAGGATRHLLVSWSYTNVTGSTTASVYQVPSGIVTLNNLSASFITTNTTHYTINILKNGAPITGSSIRYDVDFECKYRPVVIKFKNQFGQFDYITFPKAKYEDFEVSENTFQPQLGTWEASALEISAYSTLRKRYYIDTVESLTVNTDWIPESYNEWLKQLLVSDEVYQVTPVPNTGNYELVPLVIKTKNIRFKTFVNDKLINYTFEFLIGRSYKLIV